MAHFDPRFSVHVPLVPIPRKRRIEQHNPVTAVATQILQDRWVQQRSTEHKRKIVELELAQECLPKEARKSTASFDVVNHSVSLLKNDNPKEISELLGEYYEDIPSEVPKKDKYFRFKIQVIIQTLALFVRQDRLHSLSDDAAKAIVKLFLLFDDFEDYNSLADVISIFSKQQLVQNADFCPHLIELINDKDQQLANFEQYRKKAIISVVICVMDLYLIRAQVEKPKPVSERRFNFFTNTDANNLLDIMTNIISRNHYRPLLKLAEEDIKILTRYLSACYRELGQAFVEEKSNQHYDSLTAGIYRSELILHRSKIIKSVHTIARGLGLNESSEEDVQALEPLLLSNCCSVYASIDLFHTYNLMCMYNYQPSHTTHQMLMSVLHMMLRYESRNFNSLEGIVLYLSCIENFSRFHNICLKASKEKVNLLEKLYSKLYLISHSIQNSVNVSILPERYRDKLYNLGIISFLIGYDPDIENEIIVCINHLQSSDAKNETLGMFLCSVGLFLHGANKPLSNEFYNAINEYLSKINFTQSLVSRNSRNELFTGLAMFIRHLSVSKLIIHRATIDTICSEFITYISNGGAVYRTQLCVLQILSMFIENGFAPSTELQNGLVELMFSPHHELGLNEIISFFKTAHCLFRNIKTQPHEGEQEILKLYLQTIEPYMKFLSITDTAYMVSALDYLFDVPPKALGLLQSRLNRQLTHRNLGH
jgi:hypothetical protein